MSCPMSGCGCSTKTRTESWVAISLEDKEIAPNFSEHQEVLLMDARSAVVLWLALKAGVQDSTGCA